MPLETGHRLHVSLSSYLNFLTQRGISEARILLPNPRWARRLFYATLLFVSGICYIHLKRNLKWGTKLLLRFKSHICRLRYDLIFTQKPSECKKTLILALSALADHSLKSTGRYQGYVIPIRCSFQNATQLRSPFVHSCSVDGANRLARPEISKFKSVIELLE